MLAMHYAIPLRDTDQVAAIRRRAAERGPLFDAMPGLGAKLFLIDPRAPCYATFYLWRDPTAALRFLDGDFFRALCDAFGRPAVHLLLSAATSLDFAAGSALRLQRGTVDADAPVRACDPRDATLLGLAKQDAPGRRFEVMYRAIGAAA
ncbi:MAG: DUF4865 family protein [Rhodospirillales bacterium]|nr:DUF4865 family protein [Rhodospirillales bacterium]